MTTQYDIFGRPIGLCVFCHDDISSLITTAHIYHENVRRSQPDLPDINDTADLCWSCHLGLLHAGIISVKEVVEARRATLAGTRKVTHDQVYRQIAVDLARGRRRVDWRALHNSTPEQLSERAKRAWETRLSKPKR